MLGTSPISTYPISAPPGNVINGTFYSSVAANTVHTVTVPLNVTPAMPALFMVGTGDNVSVTITATTSGTGSVTLIDNRMATNMCVGVFWGIGLKPGDTVTFTLSITKFTAIGHQYRSDVSGFAASPGIAVRPASQSTTDTGSVTPAAVGQLVILGFIDRTTTAPTLSSITSSGSEVVTTRDFQHSATSSQPVVGVAFADFYASAIASRTATATYSGGSTNGEGVAILGLPLVKRSGVSIGSDTPNTVVETSVDVAMASSVVGAVNYMWMSATSTGETDPAPTTPTGWTLLGSGSDGTGPPARGWLWRRVFETGDPSSVTVNFAVATNATVCCFAYEGLDQTTPERVVSIGSQTPSSTAKDTNFVTTLGGWVVSGQADRNGGGYSAFTDVFNIEKNHASSGSCWVQDTERSFNPGNQQRTMTGPNTSSGVDFIMELVAGYAPVAPSTVSQGWGILMV